MSGQEYRPPQDPSEGGRDRDTAAASSSAVDTAPSSAAPAAATLCLAGCGFWGDVTRQNYCSICFKKHVGQKSLDDLHRDNEEDSMVTIDCVSTTTGDSVQIKDLSAFIESAAPVVLSGKKRPSGEISGGPAASEDSGEVQVAKVKSRCAFCSKKLKLSMSFQCRCDGVFCSTHRYFDSHNCSFDHRADAKTKLEKNNPVVKGAKIARI
eukprot:TRINITY_DN13800_c0_g1_i1.p1 TRINITY_DN13800_c0_g1~~TRINITY_DN13800_c0_g1_i1.p1  ORF type:complete len:209 (+),score=35.79 TRINITY_DN13800_c0_g1_i1:200-826(+)